MSTTKHGFIHGVSQAKLIDNALDAFERLAVCTCGGGFVGFALSSVVTQNHYYGLVVGVASGLAFWVLYPISNNKG